MCNSFSWGVNMKVNICGIEYTVTAVKDTKDVCHDRSGKELYGQIGYSESSIRLYKTNKDRMQQVLLHEILHGIVDGMGVRELQESGSHLEIPIDQLAVGLSLALKSMGIDVCKGL